MNRIYNKYKVTRVGDDQEVPNTFPLKYDTDPVARIALRSYGLAMKARGDEEFYNEVMELLKPFDIKAKEPHCPLCGSLEFRRYTKEYHDEMENLKEAELHCVCSQCGVMFRTNT